jgi:hypothetical protein
MPKRDLHLSIRVGEARRAELQTLLRRRKTDDQIP